MEFELLANIKEMRLLYTQSFTQAGQRHNLSQPEIDVLLFVANQPQYNTARDIASRRGLAKSNISKAVEMLRQKELLEVCEDEKNRRVRRLFPTAKAEPVIEELRACQAAFFGKLFDGFTPEELAQLERLMQHAAENLHRQVSGGAEPAQDTSRAGNPRG